MKAKVVQTFYIPHANMLFKIGEIIETDPSFANQYRTCLEVIGEKTAPAPENKMVTAEKEFTKSLNPAKSKMSKGRK